MMIRFPILTIAALALAACDRAGGGAAQPAETAAMTGPTAAPGQATMAAAASPAAKVPVTAREVSVSDDLMEFSYSYPASAGAVPALRALLDADIAKQKKDLRVQAIGMRKEARESGFPFRPPGYWAAWQTVTDLPGWLSLSAEVSTYEGGAHPNHGFDTILWDRQAGRRRDPVDLFSSGTALSAAIRASFCRALDAQRREKRGGDGRLDGGIGEFDACIDPLENGTLILGSSGGQAFDRLGILVPPYNAGPYAEGSYEVTLPVTGAVMRAVRPEFRAAFAAGR